MSRFLQLHLLTFFPPSNLNRDDMGSPKTAIVGGEQRLRISSQALKRAWRTSPVFSKTLQRHMGARTQRLGEEVFRYLTNAGHDESKAHKVARLVAELFGKVKQDEEKQKRTSREIEQLSFIAPSERENALRLADRLVMEGESIDKVTDKKKEEWRKEVLKRTDTAADVALFGRMLASSPEYNWEAAAQVAHAITTHRVTVEDDFYVAVDDWKTAGEDAGAGFLGEAEFGSGVFYLYLCVNRDLLRRNLGEEETASGGVMAQVLGALVEAAATVAPSGKQNSYAALSRAHYVLAEKGDQQPRSLAGAFVSAVRKKDLMQGSIDALRNFRAEMTKVYGKSMDCDVEMQVGREDTVTLKELIAFCQV